MDQTHTTECTEPLSGAPLIRAYVERLPNTPGVYRMFSESGDVLYVGKAKSLKKRVMSYTLEGRLPFRLQRMVALTRRMEFIQTQTEIEALLLESNLIKKLKPRFNILLRDDKSFPYILIPQDHDFPQVTKHRGAKIRKGDYFGPFAGAGNVNDTITILQKAFMLRTCPDTVFAHRTRPCLQYHIKRCSAPCVGFVNAAEYAAQVAQARQFLSGESQALQTQFSDAMLAASAAMDFEKAAILRDKIKALASVQAHQDINVAGLKEADVFALALAHGQACIQVFFFRGGANYGNRAYFPRHASEESPEDILAAFLAQFYENKPVPREILLSHDISEKALLLEALTYKAEHSVRLDIPQKGPKTRVMAFALRNAEGALSRHQTQNAQEKDFLAQVGHLFTMPEPPKRIEVYDNSHIAGTDMVGAMIAAGEDGFIKPAYRKFNIREAKAGDDFGMMREVMTRRFGRAIKEHHAPEDWPDLILIDGGAGQFTACRAVLEEMGLWDRLRVVAIAKGPDRHAGREWFYTADKPPFQLPVNTPVLQYLQRLRDEVHRFAIGTHRARRQKHITDSPLDEIAGIGAKRKKALLLYFGSAKAVAGASVEDLQKIEGLSKSIAQKIYDHFHA